MSKRIIVTDTNIHTIMKLSKGTKLTAFKYANNNGGSHYRPHTRPILICKPGARLVVSKAKKDKKADCGAGVNVATKDWIYRRFFPDLRARWGAIWVVHFYRRDIACIPYMSRGKFRLFRCTVVRRTK